MARKYWKTVPALGAAAFLQGGLPAAALAAGDFDARLDRQIASADIQIASAERDLSLVQETRRSFLTLSDDGAPAVDIDRALTPLRQKYPDYRLQFRGADDFCRVKRGISEAGRAVYRRLQEGLLRKAQAFNRRATYAAVLMELKAAEMFGEPFGEDHVEQAFLRSIEPNADVPQTDFGELDSLDGSMSDPCD